MVYNSTADSEATEDTAKHGALSHEDTHLADHLPYHLFTVDREMWKTMLVDPVDWPTLLSNLEESITPSSTQDIIDYLERVLRILALAVNDRRTAPDDPVYLRTVDTEAFQGTVRHSFKHDVGWREFRLNFVDFIREFPDYSIVPLSISTNVDEGTGTATSFVNMQHIGQPTGVVIQGVAFFRLKRTILSTGRQQWLCSRIEFVDGNLASAP